jgi:hypothetical protein
MEAVRAMTVAAFSGVSIPILRNASTVSGGIISGSALSCGERGAPVWSGDLSFPFECSRCGSSAMLRLPRRCVVRVLHQLALSPPPI